VTGKSQKDIHFCLKIKKAGNSALKLKKGEMYSLVLKAEGKICRLQA
jgi:hypothetical protein